MNVFDLTRTPITAYSKVKLFFLIESETYQGRAYQGFISRNDHFKLLSIPFEAEYEDRMRYFVEETNEDFLFAKKALLRATGLNEDIDWQTLQEKIISGEMVTTNGKFINIMAIREDVFDFISEQDLESCNHMVYKSEKKHFEAVRDYIEKTLNPILEEKENIKEESKSNFVYSIVQPKLNIDFIHDTILTKEVIYDFEKEKALNLLTELLFLNSFSIERGLYFMPQTCCQETISPRQLSKYNLELSKKQWSISEKEDEDSIPFEIEAIFTVKKDVLLNKIKQFGLPYEEINSEIEQYIKKGVFDFKIKKRDKDSLLDSLMVGDSDYNKDEYKSELLKLLNNLFYDYDSVKLQIK
tara:strand:+ start:1726 stop:2790 length:1065 start_codon:yes stop_codon:yes gene_type:complete